MSDVRERGWEVTNEEFEEMCSFVRSHLEETMKDNGDRMRWYPWHSAEYRYDHTKSVVNLAEKIAREEEADVDVVRVGALFHDVAKFEVKHEKHAEEGAWTAQKYLSNEGYPDTFIDRVAQVIRDHTEEMNDDLPLESKILIEADSIDKIGVAGATLMGLRVGYESRSHKDVPGMMERVINRGESMTDWIETETGERIVRERIERVKTYKNWFEDEL
ncbi:MAG: HD domain-containing protein [Halobacteria archaeon]|nr:HD domain-containing protein [Halobacteria archaeon]